MPETRQSAEAYYTLTSVQCIVRALFSHHASVVRIGKNPITPVLFVRSMTLSVLSVLIGRFMLRFLATGDVIRAEKLTVL